MLGKLIKYEFKNTAKVMLTLYLFISVITLIGAIVLSRDFVQHTTGKVTDALSIALVVIYLLAIFALFIITYIYMCFHFYKTMYSDQGYLTHTLPVKPLSIFHVKLFVSMIWILASCLMLFLSVLALLTGISRGEIWTEIDGSLFEEFSRIFGMPLGQFVAYTGFSLIFSCLSSLLWIYASLSIGQLFGQHKIGASVIAGIVIYMVNQICSAILMVVTGYSSSVLLMEMNDTYANTTSQILGNFLDYSLLYTVAYVLALYVVCNVIVRKHINLD